MTAIALFDWQADEDGDVTALDMELVLSVLDRHDDQCVRDAARKVARELTICAQVRPMVRIALTRDPSLRRFLSDAEIAWAGGA